MVQKAFHARTTKWSGCTGDFDAICPLTATRYSIMDLELSVMEPWRPWTASKEAMFSATLEVLCLFQ
nr:unnamed protein product [Digitaria exilis]